MSVVWFFFFQAEDGIRDLVRSRGLGDVYKRQVMEAAIAECRKRTRAHLNLPANESFGMELVKDKSCLLYTSDAADERSSVDLGGRRIIKKKKTNMHTCPRKITTKDNKSETPSTQA